LPLVVLSHPKISISKICEHNAFTKIFLGLHGMAYYIFLKSLSCLEEFRKIHTSKFLLILLVQISKAWVNSKIQFFFRKGSFFRFRPSRLPTYLAFRPSCSPIPYLQPKPALPLSRSRATMPSTPGLPWSPFLPALVLPLLLYSMADATPLQVSP
jgi:hypothetical protein